MHCPKCWSSEYVKNGIHLGKQRYKCKSKGCHCNFTKSETWRIKFEIKIMALKLYLEWMWLRGIGRILWVSNVSVLNWIRMFWYIALELQKEYTKDLKYISHLELDEMWHFVQKKLTNYGFGWVQKKEKQELLHGLVELVEKVDDINFLKQWKI